MTHGTVIPGGTVAATLLVLLSACQLGTDGSGFLLPASAPTPVQPLTPTQPAAAVAPTPPTDAPTEARPPTSPPREPAASGGQAAADPLTLDEVWASVAESYPLLSVAAHERRIARARELAALGGFDLRWVGGATSNAYGFYRNETLGLRAEQPIGLSGADLNAGYRLGTGDFDPTFDGKRVTNRGGEFFAGARVPLLRNSALDGRRRALRNAALEREVADADARKLRIEVANEAAATYWRWVAAGQRRTVAQALLDLAETRQEGIAARVRRGDLPEIEAIDNERLVVGRRALQIAAARAVEKSAIALSLFWRGADLTPRRASSDRLPPALPLAAEPRGALLEDDVRRALAQRPELAALDAVRRTLEVDRAFYESQRLPRLDFSVDGSQDLSRDDPSLTKGEFELFLALDVGIETQNRRAIGQLLEIDSRTAALDQELRLQRDRIAAEVRDAFSELTATHAGALQVVRAAELAEQLADAERRRFVLGDSTVLVLNLREEAAAEARLRVVDALTAYAIAVARYRAAVGEDPLPAVEPRR